MGIRRAGTGDEDELRELRIRALRDSPERFGSTVAREQARTTEDWQRWFSPGATFLFESEAGDAVGLVAVMRPDEEPTLAQLISMWVAPEARGLGVGDALVQAMLGFAADSGASVGRVHVYDSNDRAIRLYERNGFVGTGARTEPDALGRVEAELVQPIEPARARRPGPARPMTADRALDVLDLLATSDVEVWLDGGWAVDALLGEQTRSHADLDLAVPITQQRRCVEAMRRAGFTTVGFAPANAVMADADGRRVDVHLVDLEHTMARDDGVDVHGPAGIAYEVGAFGATGTIAGRAVPCCAAAFLVRAHTGYAIDADDVADVTALCRRFAIALPDQHARFLTEHGGARPDR
jgi:lincosamide nucleotidyltransferase A/C/D/E